MVIAVNFSRGVGVGKRTESGCLDDLSFQTYHSVRAFREHLERIALIGAAACAISFDFPPYDASAVLVSNAPDAGFAHAAYAASIFCESALSRRARILCFFE